MARRAIKPSIVSNGITDMGSRYTLTRSEVNTLLADLENPSFIGDIIKLFTTPIDNIISLYAYPFDVKELLNLSQFVDGAIQINLYRTPNAVGAFLNPVTTPLLDIGAVTISPFFNSFLDYAPYTKIELYLPYIGFIELDTNIVMGKRLSIKYAVDLYSGKCTAYVAVGRDTEETVIMIRDGNIGMQIQIAGGNGAEMARNMLQFGVGAIGGATSIGLGLNQAVRSNDVDSSIQAPNVAAQAVSYLGSSTINAISSQQRVIHKGGTTSANNWFYGPQNAYLIFTRPVINRPTSYESNVGRPSGKTATLGDLTGYTVVDSVHVEGDGLNEATQAELSEIERLLKTGVIL